MHRLLLIPVLLVAALSLSACSSNPVVDSAASQFRDHAGSVQDDAVEFARWIECDARSMASWQREFANDQKRAIGWAILCSKDITVPPLKSQMTVPPPSSTPQSNEKRL